MKLGDSRFHSLLKNKKFYTVSCAKFWYTELYKTMGSTGMNIIDFLMSH